MRYTITFDYQGKRYAYADDFEYEDWDETRNADYRVIYMYTEGNYGCDCNRSAFIAEQHQGFPELDCGREITLVSIQQGEYPVWPEPTEHNTTIVYVQQPSGLYMPRIGEIAP